MAADPAAAAESVAPLKPSAPSTTSSDTAEGSDPTTTSHTLRKTKIQQRQNQRQRSDRVQDAFALDDRLGFERDRWPPANSTRSGGRGSSPPARSRVAATDCRLDRAQARVQRARERRVIRRAPGLRHHQTPLAVLRQVALRADAEVHPGIRSAQRIADELGESNRILPDQGGDLRRRDREQLAPRGDGRGHALRPQSIERAVQRRSAEEQQLAIGEPSEVARAIDDAGVDAADLGRLPQQVDPLVDFLRVVGDGVPLGRGEDDVQLVDVAERRQELPEGGHHAAVAREQGEHVGVERHPANAFGRDDHQRERQRPRRVRGAGKPKLRRP